MAPAHSLLPCLPPSPSAHGCCSPPPLPRPYGSCLTCRGTITWQRLQSSSLMSAKEAAQRGSTPDVTPPCPTPGAATSSDDVPAALEQAGDLVASYLSEEMAEGAEAEAPSSQPARAGQVPLPAYGAQAMAQAPVPVAPTAAARPATAGIGTLQQSLAAGVQHTLAQGIATGAVDAPRLVSVAANGALTFDFGAPGPAAAAAVGGSSQPNGSAPGALQSGPMLGGPGGGAVGGAVQPAAPAHGMRGVVEAPPGSGQFKLAVKLLTQVGPACLGRRPALAAGLPCGCPGGAHPLAYRQLRADETFAALLQHRRAVQPSLRHCQRCRCPHDPRLAAPSLHCRAGCAAAATSLPRWWRWGTTTSGCGRRCTQRARRPAPRRPSRMLRSWCSWLRRRVRQG